MAVILLLLLLTLIVLVLTGHVPDTRDADFTLHPLTPPPMPTGGAASADTMAASPRSSADRAGAF